MGKTKNNRIPKNIVLSSDGTGNRGGKDYGTNVWRLHNYIDLNNHKDDPKKPRQLTYYGDGVGTEDNKFSKFLGGAFGWGLSRNIRELYYFLVQNYQPGDNIFLFGFSRGAFTARSLAGFIGTCGIVNRRRFSSVADVKDAVKDAYAAYRRAHREKDRRIAVEFGQKFCFKNVPVKCIGVWDTVGAIGVPFDELRSIIDAIFKISFHKLDLGKYVEYGFHALALDDERRTFHPVMWDEQQSQRKQGSIEQVWFPGVHSNAGGGYPKQGMSYGSLYWMMNKVKKLGLRFEKNAIDSVRRMADANDKLYDSRSGLAFYYRYLPRDIDAICGKNCDAGKARVHFSVLERVDVFTLDYAPGNFPEKFTIVTTDASELPAGMNQQSLKQLQERITKHRKNADNNQLLSDAKRWIYPRHFAHVLFVLASIALLAGAWYLSRHPIDMTSPGAEWVVSFFKYVGYLLPAFINEWLKPLVDYFSLHPGRFVLALVVFVGLLSYPRILKRRMMKKFIEYWNRARPRLFQP